MLELRGAWADLDQSRVGDEEVQQPRHASSNLIPWTLWLPMVDTLQHVLRKIKFLAEFRTRLPKARVGPWNHFVKMTWSVTSWEPTLRIFVKKRDYFVENDTSTTLWKSCLQTFTPVKDVYNTLGGSRGESPRVTASCILWQARYRMRPSAGRKKTFWVFVRVEYKYPLYGLEKCRVWAFDWAHGVPI